MNIRTTSGAVRLFIVLVALVATATSATAEDFGPPPGAPSPAGPLDDAYMPLADEPPPAPPDPAPPAADDAVDVRDAVVIEDAGPQDGPAPVFERAPSACCGVCSQPDPCCPNPCCDRGWDITLEAAATFFENPGGILGLSPGPGVPTFNWSESSLDTAFGGRVTIGYRRTTRDRFEGRASYSGEATGTSRQANRSFGFSPTPGAAVAASPAATATLDTEASVWSGEINWWRTLICNDRWRVEGIAGVRYVRYEEVATARSWVGLAGGSFLSNTATSRFIGAQLGASTRWHGSRHFEAAVSVKALLGHMQIDASERDTAIVTGGPTTNASRETSDFGYGFEAEVSFLLRLSRRVGLTAAYTLLYLGDVSRASSTLDFSQAMTGSLQVSGATESNVIHSVFAGIRIDV